MNHVSVRHGILQVRTGSKLRILLASFLGGPRKIPLVGEGFLGSFLLGMKESFIWNEHRIIDLKWEIGVR